MQVKNLTIEDKNILTPFLNEQTIGWEGDFATLFCWDVNGTMKVIFEDGIVIFCNKYYGKTVFMPPFTINADKLPRAFEMIISYANDNNIDEYIV